MACGDHQKLAVAGQQRARYTAQSAVLRWCKGERHSSSATAGWALFAGYVGYNFLRKTWPTAIAQPQFAKHLPGLNMNSIGSISTMHSVMYGVSKFGSSVLCDFFAERTPHVFVSGLLLCGVAAMLMATCKGFEALTALWALQGMLQGLVRRLTSRIAGPQRSRITFAS